MCHITHDSTPPRRDALKEIVAPFQEDKQPRRGGFAPVEAFAAPSGLRAGDVAVVDVAEMVEVEPERAGQTPPAYHAAGVAAASEENRFTASMQASPVGSSGPSRSGSTTPRRVR